MNCAGNVDSLQRRAFFSCASARVSTSTYAGVASIRIDQAMAPLPRTRFDAVEWESRKADKEGVVAVDGHRYLAGPSWRGWRLEVGLRAFDVEIRTGDGRKVAGLPRAYGEASGTVRDPAAVLPALPLPCIWRGPAAAFSCLSG